VHDKSCDVEAYLTGGKKPVEVAVSSARVAGAATGPQGHLVPAFHVKHRRARQTRRPSRHTRNNGLYSSLRTLSPTVHPPRPVEHSPTPPF